ncbi:hypothetical protein K458DRAFT_387509 [Lentithecium fluviatile CBS 122367]|uniref:Uncharacterized protein n=1 Tax=Lentithecium fluviatile CBS 122367 TaxID=1168545 RepID=A0A6G1J561_9PLEO|nr:hypothetical protein K458DRAFT_387509 [Lentithecium fluviatile CBS 122367]
MVGDDRVRELDGMMVECVVLEVLDLEDTGVEDTGLEETGLEDVALEEDLEDAREEDPLGPVAVGPSVVLDAVELMIELSDASVVLGMDEVPLERKSDDQDSTVEDGLVTVALDEEFQLGVDVGVGIDVGIELDTSSVVLSTGVDKLEEDSEVEDSTVDD